MRKPEKHVRTGESIFVPWAELDNTINSWAKETFGAHVYASGCRGDEELGITLLGLKESDKRTFADVYDTYDEDKSFEWEFDFATGEMEVIIPAAISRKIMEPLLIVFGLEKCSEAIAVRNGVFFTEHRCDGTDIPEVRYRVEGIRDSEREGWFRATELAKDATQTAAIRITFPEGEIIAEVAGDSAYPGIFLTAKDRKTNQERTMAILERPETPPVEECDGKMFLYIYGNKDSDDWTERIRVEFPSEEADGK